LESEAQREVVQQVWDEAQAAWGGRVVTEVALLNAYSPAEAYHQHYFALHPGQGYCAHVIAPKVDKFRKTFRSFLKA
jgi:peptide-methionine (S)-S-oxide reductase